ncbi:MAG: hypothetical protein Q7S87_04670 [Agitococcus sp.]|nr:hypothetical protein [Agitococcus sp.]
MSDFDCDGLLTQATQSISGALSLSFDSIGNLTQASQSFTGNLLTVNPSAIQARQSLTAICYVHYDISSSIQQPIQRVSANISNVDCFISGSLTQPRQSISGSSSVSNNIIGLLAQKKQFLKAYITVSNITPPTAEAISAKFVVSSRRDLQIPRIPLNQDKQTQSWFNSVGKIIQKYIFGEDGSRLVSAADLANLGIVGVGSGGNVTPPKTNLTTPPKVTGLTADGALATIIIQWHNPSFSNFGYTELWRSSVDDVGQAVIIAKTSVEGYVDNVGSAATKYYWARVVSDSGVKGEFNAAAGVKGETSYNPDYVKQLLTTVKWLPNTTYAPYQYVQPTVENGYQYMVIDGGISASIEPTWPTTVNNTVNDGSIEWQCIAATERLPLVVGRLEDGSPAVFIDTAFIKNASITSAKIGNLVADKITTGDLNANIRILQKLWYGFDEFANPAEQSGFWMGVENGIPKLKLDTGMANGNKYFVFDGVNLYMNVDILSGADGYFDDLAGDSVSFNRANFDFLAFGEQVTASQYVYDNDIPISEPEFNQYLCFPSGCQKTESWTSSSLVTGSGYSRPFAFFQTGEYSSIRPYDYRSDATRYRASKDHIGFSILINVPTEGNPVGNEYGNAYMDVYIFSESQSLPSNNYNDNSVTSGIPSQYLLKMQLNTASDGVVTAYKNTGTGDVAAVEVELQSNVETNPNQTLIVCGDDLGVLGYKENRKLKVAVVFKAFYQAGGSDDDTLSGQITVSFQMVSVPSSDFTTPINDQTLAITATANKATTFLSLTYAEETALRAIIKERINYREPL